MGKAEIFAEAGYEFVAIFVTADTAVIISTVVTVDFFHVGAAVRNGIVKPRPGI